MTRVQAALEDAGLDALICTEVENVLLLTGYWPVVGTAIAVALRDGRFAVLAPQDERDLAERGWAEVHTYQPGSLQNLASPVDNVRGHVHYGLRELGLASGTLGIDDGSFFTESSYSAAYRYSVSLPELLRDAAPKATILSGMPAVSRLRAVLTRHEVGQIELACRIAAKPFRDVISMVRPGAREPEIATHLSAALESQGLGHPDVVRSIAFAWCMSGPNSAEAGGAYARTRNRQLEAGDFVLVHSNSCIDGFWTDITRTYCLGEPTERQRAMYDAVFAARAAALESIRPGARAADVDGAARRVIAERGFGEYFTHGLGHNVGFSAISPDFPPRLHPASPDVLEAGMTFNVEPSIYIKGYGGLRHCDVVTVTDDGAEVLTPFQCAIEELILAE